MNIPRPHVVFDCNVLFQALVRRSGPAAECLKLVERNAVTLFISKAGLDELRKILAYPELREANPQLTDAAIQDFISHLLFRAEFLREVPRVLTLSRDPNDEPYLNLAAATEADFLVTRDNDLLSLREEHDLDAKQFRQKCPALRIVTPAEFLQALLPAP